MDFGEYLADMAGRGYSLDAPIPRPYPRSRLDEHFYDDELPDETPDTCTPIPLTENQDTK